MGRTLTIGDVTIDVEHDSEERQGRSTFSLCVARREEARAPAFPGAAASAHKNSMYFPSTSLWDTVETFLVTPLFLDYVTGILQRGEPGIYSFVAADVDAVDAAIKVFRDRARLIEPHFDGSIGNVALARMMWLAWWMRWTLKNCENPAIEIG